MNLTVEVQSEVNEDEWDHMLTKSKHATGFQSAYFFKPNQIAYGSKPIFIKVLDTSGEIVGQLSAIINVKEIRHVSNSFSKMLIDRFNFGSNLQWKHGPVIHDHVNHKEISSQILSTIEQICKKNKIELVKGTTPPLDQNFTENYFKNFGYLVTSWKNYVIKLPEDPNSHFASLHNKIRYDVRKGEKNGLTFEIAKNINEINEFGMLKYGKRQDDPELVINEGKIGIETAWDYHFKKGLRKLFLVRLNGKLIGGINALVFNDIVCHTTVVNSSQKNLQGGSFLTWNSIKWAIENEHVCLDLGGVNPSPKNEKEKGIDHYKSKWNGTEYKIFIFSKIVRKNRSKFSSLLRRF